MMLKALLLVLLCLPCAAASPSDATGAGRIGADCIPAVSPGDDSGFAPALHVTCDESGAACGILEQPICWSIRFGCYMALVAVLNAYDYNVRELRGLFEERRIFGESSCEGQP